MLDLRDRFVVPPAPAVELRAFTHGLMPASVPAMLQHFADDWATRGVDAWNAVENHWRPGSGEAVGWWTLPEYLGDAFITPMLQAPAGTCVMQPNVHHTVSYLLSCAEPFADGRREVVFTGAEFPSVQHAVRQWAGLTGVIPHVVPPAPDGSLDAEAVIEAVTDRTAWVFVSHVGFTTGEKAPDAALLAIAERAHRHGAHFGIDGYHASGSVPVAVERLGCDVYFGGLLKEGCASAGNAYLHVRDGAALTPRLSGWFADADPFGFKPEPQPHPVVRRRFLAGTTAVAPLYHAVEGLRVLLDVGLEAVRADALAKTAHALAHADRLGLPVRSPREDDRRGVMVILEVEGADRLSEWLKTQGVYTDSRQGRYLRFAPFVYNPVSDVDRLFEAIEAGLAEGVQRHYEAPATSGPVT
jgi:kynureninase